MTRPWFLFLIVFATLFSFAAPSQLAAQGSLSMEDNVNRTGYDYNNFDLPRADPNLCKDACGGDGRCLAYTYVRPGVQGAQARCWLKYSPAPAQASNCCVSGVKIAAPAAAGLEFDADRPGGDYNSFNLPNDPLQCKQACDGDARCAAFTFVRPGTQGTAPRCWLKNVAAPPRSNPCCISGAKAGRTSVSAACSSPVGRWNWVVQGIVVEFRASGEFFTNQEFLNGQRLSINGRAGTWTQNGTRIALTWTTAGSRDDLILSGDGNSLSGNFAGNQSQSTRQGQC